MSATVALLQREKDKEQYYRLMATAMGSIESVLNNFRLAPRQEAYLTLRYASLLYEETDNHMDLEKYVGKGIALAERNRMFDLKYSMQYLEVQAVFRSKPKAALKLVDNIVAQVVA